MDATSWLLHTAVWYMVLVFFTAGITIFGIIAITNKIPFKILINNYVYFFLFCLILMVSLMVWQYAAKHSGQWIYILIGTLVEIASGIILYSALKSMKINHKKTGKLEGGKILSYYTIYLFVICFLAFAGAHAWKGGMELAYGEARLVGMIAVGVSLFLLAIIIGRFSFMYVDGVAIPFMYFNEISERVANLNKRVAVGKAINNGEDFEKWPKYINRVNIENPPLDMSMKAFHDFCEIRNGRIQENPDDWTIAILGDKLGFDDWRQAQDRCVDGLIKRLSFDQKSNKTSNNGQSSEEVVKDTDFSLYKSYLRDGE